MLAMLRLPVANMEDESTEQFKECQADSRKSTVSPGATVTTDAIRKLVTIYEFISASAGAIILRKEEHMKVRYPLRHLHWLWWFFHRT